jgi:undecaprenyl diphosphate synthase
MSREEKARERPDLDLVIRTSGEQRSSGFFPAQTLYSEWVYEPKLFPDFTVLDLVAALDAFRARDRRKGA